MIVAPLPIDGALAVTLRTFGDARGTFQEIWRSQDYASVGIAGPFVQDNRSTSTRHVLRGLHYQIGHPQGHLVTAVSGRVFDVGLDMRLDSLSFGRWAAVTLGAEGPHQAYWPAGVAHGYCVLGDHCELLYKCTDFYVPGDEGGVLWCDPDLAIEWPLADPVINQRDAGFPRLKDIPRARLPNVQTRR